MIKNLLAAVAAVVVFSCSEKPNVNKPVNGDTGRSDTTIVTLNDNTTPTVDLPKFTLIQRSGENRADDAKEILQVKRRWPLAMQSLNPAEFEAILSRNFTFKGSNRFFNRREYIKDRTTPDEWKIVYVKYDNVTLQFFGDTGILSYVNHITNRQVYTGAIEYEHISWVDIYVRENGKWKIGAAHSIDYRLEVPGK
jgi:hypothetical protein